MPQYQDQYESGRTKEPAGSQSGEKENRRPRKSTTPATTQPTTPAPVIPTFNRSGYEGEKKESAYTQRQKALEATTTKQPVFWETDEFKTFVKNVKANRGRNPTPLSSTETSVAQQSLNNKIQKSATEERFGSIQEQKQAIRNTVSQDVLAEIKKSIQLPPLTGQANYRELKDVVERMSQEQLNSTEVQKFIDAETENRFLNATVNQNVLKQSKEGAVYSSEFFRKQVEEDVKQGLTYIPPGASKEDVQKFIEKETEKRLDAYKPPRFVFITGEDGTQIPVYMAKEDERKAFMQSIQDKPLLQRTWLQISYDVPDKLMGLLRGLGEPSLKAEEYITDQDSHPGDVGAALIQTGLNVAILGSEYFQAVARSIFATEGRWKYLQEQADQLKATDPEKAVLVQGEADHWKREYEKSKFAQQRIKEAQQAVMRSWADVQGAQEYIQAHPELYGSSRAESFSSEIKEAYAAEQLHLQTQAKEDASSYRLQAQQSYTTGNYEEAVTLIKQAQKADRIAEAADPYGAYTWIREPEREEKFLTDTALAEIQKGAPLSIEEIRRIKEYHVNSNTELLGQFVIDPINFIPAPILEGVLKVPFKLTGKAIKAVATEFPAVGKALDIMGAPVRWLTRVSVLSAGDKVADIVHNNIQQVARAYETTADIEKGIGEVSDAIIQAKRLSPQEAEKFFEIRRTEVLGLQNLSFDQFKKLMDAGDIIDPTQWAPVYTRALTKAEDDLTQIALKQGKAPEEFISDAAKNRRALDDVANVFKSSYTDPHKIFKFKTAQAFTDDTIAGWVTKTLRNLSGDEINEALKLTKLDEWVQQYGKTLKPGTRSAIANANKALEGFLHVTGFLRDQWVKLVLSTPRFPLMNMMDTAGRYAISGGDLLDSLKTLFTSTQKTFADELGIVPRQISQSMASAGVDISEHVTSKLLYEDYKPQFGVLSWWKEEYRRLGNTDNIIAKREIINKSLAGLPEGKFKNAMMWLSDGFRVKTPLLLDAFPGAIRSFNDAIEFTFRIRMFHDEYFRVLERLEPEILSKSIEGLSPASQKVAQQIWRASENNPARMQAYLDALSGKITKGAPADWSFLVPDEVINATRAMDTTQRQLFIRNFRSSLEEYFGLASKTGRSVTGEELVKFVDDYSTQMKNDIQEVLSQNYDVRNIDSTIRKDGRVNRAANVDDLQGSAPKNLTESPRNEVIQKATEQLRKGKKWQKPVDVVNNFSEAVSKYASVQRVSGEGIRRTIKDGKTILEVGDNVLKGKASEVYSKLHDALLDVFNHTDEDLILRRGFSSTEEYGQVVRQFMDDPAAVLASNEKQFAAIADQFTNHPQLRDLIERTGKNIKFESTLDVYRNYGVFDNEYGFSRDARDIMEEMADQKVAIPGWHRAAAEEEGLATTNLARLRFGETLPESVRTKIGQYIEQWDAYRKGLRQFNTFIDPGPKMFSVGEGRQAAWNRFYEVGADSYLKEAKLKNDLIALFETDPAAAEKLIDDASQDFADYFLKENGITVQWDKDRNVILNVEVSRNGKIRNYSSPIERANVEQYFYSSEINKKIKNTPLIPLDPTGKLSVKKQITYALRDTFNLPTARAEAWASVIDAHAQQWAKTTGQDIAQYYERLGFQKLENAYGLAGSTEFRLTKKGAVQRTAEGQFVFYGLGQSNFESMVRETGELFYDDLISMAEHSPQSADDLKALNEFIESKTGIPVHRDTLTKEQSKVFSELFTRYVAEGSSESIKLKKPFEMFKKYLAGTFDMVKATEIGAELSDDLYRTMNRLFVEDKMLINPTTNARSIKLAAREAGVEFADEAELLQKINDAVKPVVDPKIQKEWQAWTQSKVALKDFPSTALESPDKFRQYVLFDKFTTDSLDIENTFAPLLNDPNITPEIQAQIMDRIRIQQNDLLNEYTKMVEGVDRFDLPKTQTYTSLSDVPKDVAKQALKISQNPKIMEEIQGAWEAWKGQHALAGFPESALVSPDTFKAYLNERMGQEWSEVSWHYNRLMKETEEFEDAVMSYHSGTTDALQFNPRIPEAQLSDGMKVWLRNNAAVIRNYESALQALDAWKPHLLDLASGKNPYRALTKEQTLELGEWATKASKDKAEMIDVIMNGGTSLGRDIEGAIPKTNRFMIDYQHSSVFDQFMKNIFPFWKFPSRSLPFWAETMATHPQIIAAYEKIQRMSRTQRYQAGAVTSTGKPLPSLDGYIQLPGTDLWFNPLAPFSFRYALDVVKTLDDVAYQAQANEDDLDPKAFLAREFMETSQIYGFSTAPWVTFLMKKAFNLPDNVVPQYPMAPEIALIPRWFVQDQIQKANKISWGGTSLGLGDAIYPEVSWHSYLVEKQILENALMKIKSGNLTPAQVDKLRTEVSLSVKNKNTDLWKSTYKDVTNNEAYRNWGSFFTGIYAKPFTDGQAELLKLRNSINLLKSAANNEFQADIFDISQGAQYLDQQYYDTLDTDEGWIYRLYTDIGWVKNDLGQPVTNGADRDKWLKKNIQENENQTLYYQRTKELQDQLNERLRAIPVGSSYELVKPIYEWYADQKEALDYLQKPGDRVYFTNKSADHIEQDMANEWFRTINEFAPRWEVAKGEKYEEYQARVAEWQARLPELAPLYMRAFQRKQSTVQQLNALLEDQQLSKTLFKDLLAQTTPEGMDKWKIENDDIFDALNGGWKALYWDAYWNSGVMEKGYAGDLAESDFLKAHPKPPSSAELFTWIQQRYGDRFTLEEVQKWVDESGEATIEQRQTESKPSDYETRQKIWDMLSWLGPGSRNSDVFNEAFANAHGDPQSLKTWYDEVGEAYQTQPEKLQQLSSSIEEAMKALNLEAPTRSELVRYVQAQSENDDFKSLVTQELGEGFYDLLDYYSSLTPENKKTFRGNNPEMYASIQDYRSFKGQYAEEHPVWADYYGLDLTPSIENAPTYTAPTYTSGGFQAPKLIRPGQTSSPIPMPRTSQTSQHVSIPNFYIPSRLPSDIADFSPAFTQAMGDKMLWEVEQLYSKNRRLSNAAVSYLMSLSSRHPDWSKYVNRILDKNG